MIIECSPLIRCLQTASKIAEALGVTEIKINYMATEFLHVDVYPEGCPMGSLELLKVFKLKKKERRERSEER